jgi:hypothetical protein
MTVASALHFLDDRGDNAAIVSECGRAIGVLTRAALEGDGNTVPNAEATIGDVMDYECVHIRPQSDPLETLRAYRDASWRSLRRRRPLAADSIMRRAASFSERRPPCNRHGGG